MIAAVLVACPSALAADESYVDVHYTSMYSTDLNNSFVADTNTYGLQFSLPFASTAALNIKSSGYPSDNILQTVGTGSLVPWIKVRGIWYSPVYDVHDQKMIVEKAGRVMWETVVENIRFRSAAGALLPLVAEQTFYFWKEKFYLKTKWTTTGAISGIEYAELETFLNKAFFNKYNVGAGDLRIPASGAWTSGAVSDHVTIFDSSATTHGSFSYQTINKTDTESLVMKSGEYHPGTGDRIAVLQRIYDKDKHGGATATWRNGEVWTTYTQIFVSPSNGSAAGIADTAVEMNPLSATGFQVTNSLPWAGSKSLGYDNTTGAYVVQVYVPHLQFFGLEPNVYPSARIALTNDQHTRTIRLRTRLVGQYDYPAGVTGGTAMLTDANMVPNGIPVQVSKKWDNTNPTRWDAYSESFSSWPLVASATSTVWHRTSLQNWGNNVSVGLPSLSLRNYRDWGALWLETNVGQSEALTYLPDDPVQATLADFRAVNGKRIVGHDDLSPWFENAGGLEFLNLYTGSWNPAKRVGPGSRFAYGGPYLSQYRMKLRTKAGQPRVTATVTSTLLPSSTGTRTFHKIRYDFASPYTFGNIKTDLTLFSMGDLRYGYRANTLSYLNSAGGVSTVDTGRRPSRPGRPPAYALNATRPWATFHGSPTIFGAPSNNVGFVVHRFSGRFNGATMNNIAVSLSSKSTDWINANGSQAAYVVPNTATNAVQAGDYAELLVEAFTFNSDNGKYTPIQTERTYWPTTVSVTHGAKLDDFPARVQIGPGGYADLTVTGGVDFVPITVEGFASFAKPQLEEFVDGGWQVVNQSVGINDAWQTDIDEVTGTYRITYAVPTDGGTHRYRASIVSSSAPSLPSSIPTPTWGNGGSNIALNKTYSASSMWNVDYSAAKAFDGSTATRWSARPGRSSNQWLEVDFGRIARSFNKVTIDEAAGSAQIRSYKLQASNDGIVWFDITESPGTSITPNPKTIEFYPVTFKRLRLFVSSTHGVPTINEIQIFNTAHRALGKAYDASSSWHAPAPWATVAPSKAFDQDYGTRWASAAGQYNNQWLSIDFGSAITYDRVYVAEIAANGAVRRFKLQSSTNGTAWTDIPGTSKTGFPNEARVLDFAPVTSRYVRLYVITSSGNPNIREFEIYDFR